MSVDLRDFEVDGKRAASKSREDIDRKWWRLKSKAAAESITTVINTLQARQGARRQLLETGARLYGNIAIVGATGLGFARINAIRAGPRARVTYNLVQSVTDTLTSRMAENKPVPTFQASDGNYRAKRKAKNLDRFLAGVFHENKAHDGGTRAVVDACVFGDAMTHVYAGANDDGETRVVFERVPVTEILIDEYEGASTNGNVRQMHRVKIVDREALLEEFPDMRAEILAAPDATLDGGAGELVADLIRIRESWHLRSSPDATDGRHCVSIDGAMLCEDEWKRPRFPFARFSWSPRLFGFWAQGLAEQLHGLQLDISRLLNTIQQSQALMGTFKVWLKNGGKIVTEHLNNEIFALIRSEVEPKYLTPPAVQPEIYATLEKRIEMGYHLAGLSQLSASGMKPAGLDSGEAQRVYNNIESKRFMTVGRAYERYFLDLADQAIDTVAEITNNGKRSYRVRSADRDAAIDLDWKDISLPRDAYTLQCFPISSLPSEPAGRIQTVQDLMQAGIIDPKQGNRLLNFPDLQRFESLATATEDFLTERLDRIVDDAETYILEKNYDDCALALKLGLEYYARYRVQELEEAKLDLLRQWIDRAELLLAPPPAPAPISDPSMAAPANPMPPPVSALLPNVNQQPA